MRSVAADSFQRFTELEALWRAWKRCRRGKRRRPSVAAYDLDADQYLCRLHRRLRNGTYRPSLYRLQVVRDPKTRLVATPELDDRVLHHALLADIGPTYERGFLDQSFACRNTRGPHRAALLALRFTRRYRWRLSLDIEGYFASIDHATLLGLFAHRLRDPATIDLIAALLANGGEVYQTRLARRVVGAVPTGRGLPLGGYLSHWSGGLYLDGFDHFVKRTLRCPAYLRYMDDFVLFHNDRGFLEEALSAIVEWLRKHRELELHPRRFLRPTSQAGTYLGFRISRAGLAPGPKMKRRLHQRLMANRRDPEKLRRSLLAYRGLITTI